MLIRVLQPRSWQPRLHTCDSVHPSFVPCGVLLGDTPHPCETAGPKMETVHDRRFWTHYPHALVTVDRGAAAHA